MKKKFIVYPLLLAITIIGITIFVCDALVVYHAKNKSYTHFKDIPSSVLYFFIFSTKIGKNKSNASLKSDILTVYSFIQLIFEYRVTDTILSIRDTMTSRTDWFPSSCLQQKDSLLNKNKIEDNEFCKPKKWVTSKRLI